MMPDDFENTSHSVLATNLFANNILEQITTNNYWDAGNEYKPLMHTWYLGVLMQFYVLFVIADVILFKIKGKNRKAYILMWSVISIVSVVLYFIPFFSFSEKFYHLPFRLFEFGLGSLVFYMANRDNEDTTVLSKELTIGLSYIALLSLLFIPFKFVDNQYRLLATVGLSAVLVYYLPQSKYFGKVIWLNRLLAAFGVSSFSLFVWHQIVFALTRYSFTAELYNLSAILVVFGIIGLLTYLSYRYIESLRFSKKWIIVFATLFIATNAFALVVHYRAGVFYDIPELEIDSDNIHRGIWAEYCDRGYKYDKDFSNDGKPKWMVIGNSFGRDFLNVILESEVKDSVDISYTTDKKYQQQPRRLKQADVIFISSLGVNQVLVNDISENSSPTTKIVVVGEKNFGVNNGQIFCRRNSSDYLKSTIRMEAGYEERNDSLKQIYQSHNFIDMISMVKCPDGSVRAFNDNGRFISQDCRHLTKAGAEFYAKRINWHQYFK